MLRSNSRRRSRPLLGTIIEIRVNGIAADAADRAIDAGFVAIERVAALMSVHVADSELSRLNRTAHVRPVQVDPWTYDVLVAAQRFAAATDGLFDCTVAPILAAHGFLPSAAASAADASARWRDVRLLPGGRVAFQRPLALDLGGIAKGFAVDRAVDALRASGVPAGAVNAGGDLRVFGGCAEPIHVRHPGDPTRLVALGWLDDGAIATSAAYYARLRAESAWIAPIVDPRRGRPIPADGLSVSVIAEDAATADALTKPVTLLGGEAEALLMRFGARAIVIGEHGGYREFGLAA